MRIVQVQGAVYLPQVPRRQDQKQQPWSRPSRQQHSTRLPDLHKLDYMIIPVYDSKHIVYN